ncbi:MAG TPA: DNA repair protein RadA [bacterium]|nr:DNA repair protein RadA [bacterium]
MTRVRLQYVCQACGYASPRWLGRCPSCQGWNTLVEEAVGESGGRAPRAGTASPPTPLPVSEIAEGAEAHLSTGMAELDRVLGGGLVAGSVVLVGGDPGIGKSTLLTLVCQHLAARGGRALYVSGEESPGQIKLRARRLGADAPGLLVLSETAVDAVIQAAERVQPALLVVDSIQTMHEPELPAAPGSVGQVRECATALLRYAKRTGTAVVLVGHVTKEGQIAGPRVLEHIVDTVLYFEGDRHHSWRILRATKNRFGSTNEIGVFEMSGRGLREVANPSAAFLAERPRHAPGSAVAGVLEGTRPLLLEVQALVTPTVFGMPRRTASGVDYNRMIVLLAVLEKRAGMPLAGQDVYVSVAGGATVDEPGVDLALAAAVASSLRNRPVDEGAVAIGEIGLAGEIRAVPQLERRVAEAARLGFHRVVVPRSDGLERPGAIDIVAVEEITDALARLMP